MNYGHYYKLNTGRSDLSNGIAMYDYKGIEEFMNGGRHHIYITIHDAGIHFAYHYFIEGRNDQHLDCDIVTLPLPTSSLGHDNLSEAINECFNVIFPKEIGEIVHPHDPLSSGGYSSLPVFHVGKPHSNGYIIRKMILDFLFDIAHGEVFQSSPLYDRVLTTIHDNPTFSALWAKAEYYYQRQLQITSCKLFKNSIQSQMIYIDDYTRAEKRWVDVLNGPDADRILAESPWFTRNGRPSYVAKELNNVYSKKYETLPSNDILCEIKSKKKDALQYRVRQTAKKAAQAYLHRYYLPGALHVWYGSTSWLPTLLITGLLIIIIAIFITHSETSSVISGLKTIGNIILPLLFVWLITMPIGKRRKLRTIGLLNAFLPRLLAAIVSAWFVIYQFIGSFVNKGHYVSVNVSLLLILIVYVYYEISKKNQYIESFRILLRTIMLLAIAYVYAFTTGWSMLSIIGKENECGCVMTYSITQSQMLMFTTIAVFIGVFIQMLFENSKSITES